MAVLHSNQEIQVDVGKNVQETPGEKRENGIKYILVVDNFDEKINLFKDIQYQNLQDTPARWGSNCQPMTWVATPPASPETGSSGEGEGDIVAGLGKVS